jgi:hypothetical protein
MITFEAGFAQSFAGKQNLRNLGVGQECPLNELRLNFEAVCSGWKFGFGRLAGSAFGVFLDVFEAFEGEVLPILVGHFFFRLSHNWNS